jgi:rRNA maturation endonuclease Nob1
MRSNADREINDINRNIQAAQMRINEIYAAIGRTYRAETENPQGAYIQMFADLKATEEQIEQMNTRVKFLNGIVVCTNCHSDNSVNAAFCSVCGSRLPHTMVADGANRCTRCGNIINPGQMFCGVCGTKVENIPVQPQPQFNETPVQPGVQPQPQFNETPVQPGVQPQPQFNEAPVQPEVQPQPQFNEAPVQPEVQPQVNEIHEAVTEEMQVTEPQEAKQRVCPNCHTPIEADDAVFCAECGTRL